MIIDAPAEFWDWVERLEREASGGNDKAVEKLDLVQALLEELEELEEAPSRATRRRP